MLFLQTAQTVKQQKTTTKEGINSNKPMGQQYF